MNVKGEIKGDMLCLFIDISKKVQDDAPMSSSNKSRLIATTSGFAQFGDVKVSLNASVSRRTGDPEIIEKKK